MNVSDVSSDVAVVCDPRGAESEAVRAYLRAAGLGDAVWFHPRDADEIERAVVAGRVRRVVWPDLATWLQAMWDGVIVPTRWPEAGVTVEFADTRASDAALLMPTIARTWEDWRGRRRHRRAVAGALLSLLALAAAFVLLLLAH